MKEPVPEDCVPPTLFDECIFAHSAFQELGSDRALGFGVGPIPWSSIDAYASRYGISDIDEFDDLVWMIRVMDNVFLE